MYAQVPGPKETEATSPPGIIRANSARSSLLPSVNRQHCYVSIHHKGGVTQLSISEKGLTGDKLREFMRYKERKYNAVNKLNRICTLLIVFLFLDCFCNILGLSGDSWFTFVDGGIVRRAYGIFRVCPSANAPALCHSWYDVSRSLVDVRCSVSNLSVKIGTLWAAAIANAACVALGTLSAVVAVFRPTRSKFHVVIVASCLFSVPLAVIVLALHSSITKCASPCSHDADCDAGHGWVFYVYITGCCVSFLCAGLASTMRSYVYILRREVRRECRAERRMREAFYASQQLSGSDEGDGAGDVETGCPEIGSSEPLHEPGTSVFESNDSKPISAATPTPITPPPAENPSQAAPTPRHPSRPRGHSRHFSSGSQCSAALELSGRFSHRRDFSSEVRPTTPIPPTFITAADMGVQIDGATDWVYVESSDMYYSFALEMFWDPINQEYYCCRRKEWLDAEETERFQGR